MSSITFDVYRGSKEGKIVADKTTRPLRPTDVLGHEGVGVVRQVGDAVTHVQVGDRVGFGYTHEVCGICDHCISGWDQYCANKKEYGFHNHDLGSFSHGVVWNAGNVFKIPDGYDSANAAPLMCAGATVWTCLTEYGLRPTDRVGVMGIGVVVLSSSERKREEAMQFGASEYHVFSAGQEMKDFKPLKHLLLCGSANVDYPSLLPLMDVHGTIYPLTVDFKPSAVPLLFMNAKGIRIQGSLVASRKSLKSLLQFAADKKIEPTIMKFPLNEAGIEEAMQTLRDGKMRYRGVLVRE
ncbi:alcohol dehydrogenase [Aspergillus nomiae NRRL 13137]|uniref:Alcohol dehydrogenase n=1 Tax=Aspergillus nomiae NRRL (strain ATCC 15546 / NRRL 13137 / CBS 260.88 / M93) TaxID=1509407 RepID=A0A0L1JBI8_ASPN3|nr:alcohol dehydrogenase [Aspergillus nomiae NRRL 13137]KNG89119.1 alcohol dehydrogenase [Aspergillus nomiae NRRL 13137]